MEVDILAFGAHPDDVELGCGGTIIKEIKNGKKVGIIDLTRGELGTRGNADTRDSESKLAANILNISFRENMNFKDGFFLNDESHKIEIVKKIRKYRPKIVLANAISDRHPDHARGAQLIIDSCFLSGLEKINTNQNIFRPKAIYHYIQFNNLIPDFLIDISEYMDLKIKSIKQYKTQFYNPLSKETETIISSQDFFDSITYRAKDLGRQSNCKFAEGFIANQKIQPVSLFDI